MIEQAGVGWNLAGTLPARLAIAVEELFSNTIKYGYGGACERPVRIVLAASGGTITLTYEDEAPQFDPTGFRPAVAVENRPPGQAGILMVLGLSRSAVYTALEPGNRLVLAFADGA